MPVAPPAPLPAPSVKATAVLNAAGTRSTSRHSLVRRSARNTASTHLIGNASLSMHRAVSRMRPSGRRLSTLKNVDGRATWLYVSASMNACAALSLLGSGSRSKLAGSSGFGGALNPRDSSSEEVSRSRDASNTFPRNPSPTASLTNDSARRACADVSGVPPSTRRRRPRSSCTEAGACRDGDAGGVPEARDGDAGAGTAPRMRSPHPRRGLRVSPRHRRREPFPGPVPSRVAPSRRSPKARGTHAWPRREPRPPRRTRPCPTARGRAARCARSSRKSPCVCLKSERRSETPHSHEKKNATNNRAHLLASTYIALVQCSTSSGADGGGGSIAGSSAFFFARNPNPSPHLPAAARAGCSTRSQPSAARSATDASDGDAYDFLVSTRRPPAPRARDAPPFFEAGDSEDTDTSRRTPPTNPPPPNTEVMSDCFP